MPRLRAIFNRLPERSRSLAFIVLYALAAGLVAVAFQVVIAWIFRISFVLPAARYPHWFPWISLGVISSVSLLAGWLLTSFCPEAAGSGVPQLKLAFWKDFGHIPTRLFWVKFIASAFSIGGGQSLGREGPSVQLGGNIASTLAGILGVAKQNKRAAAAAGAAAGLAAAFNAPLAAVAFVLEEILEDLHSRLLGAVLVAAVIGALVVHALLGAQPAFDLPLIQEPTWRAYFLMPLVALLAALVGAVFQRSSLRLRGWEWPRRRGAKLWLPLAGGLITWVLGMSVYASTSHLGIFGLGYEDLSLVLTGGVAWRLALLLLTCKLVATIACYGLGGAGGIFSPSLFFGGMCGALLGGLGGHLLNLPPSDLILLVVGGMSACLVSVVQAPVTSVLIIFEMTHQFSLLPGLLLAVLVSQFFSRRLHSQNFYEAILHQDGHEMAHVVPPRDLRSWQNLPISAIAQFQPTVLTSLEESAVSPLLAAKPYQRFPVMDGAKLTGILLRSEFAAALLETRHPRLLPVVAAQPSQSIRECQILLIESGCGMIIIAEDPTSKPLAVVTLHDLLRAQTAMTDRAG